MSEQEYDRALDRLRAANARGQMALAKLRRGQITPEEYEDVKADRRKAVAEVTAARERLRQENVR